MMQQQQFAAADRLIGIKMSTSKNFDEYGNDLPAQFFSAFNGKNCNYWGNRKNESDIFLARFPDREKLVRMADLAVKGRIQFWHPWHMELTHSPEKIVKPKEWFIPRNGDPEWLDSLVRFTHMFDLAAAYNITGKKKYIDSFSSYLESFAKARSIRHRHWKDQLNAAIRVSNLIKSIDLFDPSSVSEHLIQSIIRQVYTDCDFLYASLGRKVGNWEVAITTSLLTVSTYFCCAPEIVPWHMDAEQRLIFILQSDTHQDGIQIEEVPLYHGEVILFLMDYMTVLKVNDITPKPIIVNTLRKMISVLDEIADPEDMIPPLGDSDRFPVSYIKNTGHLLIGLSDLVRTSAGTEADDATCSITPSIKTFDNTGWVVMRWLYAEHQTGYLLFDCSGKPFPLRSWHSHADDLNFIFHTSEGALITDLGRFTYAHDFPIYFPYTNRKVYEGTRKAKLFKFLKLSNRGIYFRDWREYFRSTLSHNTVCCDGKNQPYYDDTTSAGSFVKLHSVLHSGALFLMHGEMDIARPGKSWDNSDQANSERSSQNDFYRHSRVICGNVPDLIVVVDKLESITARDWINSIHFSPKCRIKNQGHGVNVSLGSSHYFVQTVSVPSVVITSNIDQDWVSEVYNKKVTSKTYRSVVKNKDKIIFFTIIYRKGDKKLLNRFLSEEDDLVKMKLSEINHKGIANSLIIQVTKEKVIVNNEFHGEINELESVF